VDHVAKMIVAISLHEESIEKCFHVRSTATVPYTTIAKAAQSVAQLEILPYATWREKLNQLDQTNPLRDLLPFFPTDQHQVNDASAWPYEVTNAKTILKKDNLEHLLESRVSDAVLNLYVSQYANKACNDST
jgi:hypothetical protein